MDKFLRRLFWVVVALAAIVGVCRALFLNAWTRTPQGWQFVAWQSTPLAG